MYTIKDDGWYIEQRFLNFVNEKAGFEQNHLWYINTITQKAPNFYKI